MIALQDWAPQVGATQARAWQLRLRPLRCKLYQTMREAEQKQEPALSHGSKNRAKSRYARTRNKRIEDPNAEKFPEGGVSPTNPMKPDCSMYRLNVWTERMYWNLY